MFVVVARRERQWERRHSLEKEQKKLAKLLEKAPKVEEKKPEPKKAEKPAEKEKRIKRFSPVMATQLKTALDGVKVEMTDKLKKEFQQYVEDLTDDDGVGFALREFHHLAFEGIDGLVVAGFDFCHGVGIFGEHP
mgnify:CR=1 FL=1